MSLQGQIQAQVQATSGLSRACLKARFFAVVANRFAALTVCWPLCSLHPICYRLNHGCAHMKSLSPRKEQSSAANP
jgi:hypothetical protein